ncbi:DMT family transporter [Nocardia thailandica]
MSTPGTPARRGVPPLGLLFGFAIGAGVAVQGRINGALGARLDDGIAAATISFGTGALALLLVAACAPRLRHGIGQVRTALAEGVLRPWQLLGGLCGAFFVAAQSFTVALIGVTAFTVAVVAGQLVSSLAVDRLGLGPAGRTAITATRLFAAALAIGAVTVAALGRSVPPGASVPGLPDLPYLFALLPALAGVGLAWQQAVNGRVGAVAGPFAATLANFTVGLLALLVLDAAVVATHGLPRAFPTAPWLYLGGLIGVVFIALAAVTVRLLGVLLLGLTSVAGQLAASVALDLAAGTLSGPTVVGCVIVAAAVLLAAVRPGGPVSPS